MIKKCLSLISKKDFLRLIILLFLMLLNSIVELISIGSLPLFISSIINANQENLLSNFFYKYNLHQKYDFLIFISILISLIFLIKSFFSIFFSYIENKILKKLTVNLSRSIFNNILHSDYLSIKNKNSALIIRNITNNVDSVRAIFANLLKIFKEVFVLCAIVLLIMIYDASVSIIIILFFALISYFFYKLISSTLSKRGKKLNLLTTEVYKIINQTFGTIQNIKILNKYKIFSDLFLKQNNSRYEQVFFQRFISSLPRIILELSIVIILIVIIFYKYYFDVNNENLIPLLSLLIISAIRLLPSFSIFSNSASAIKFSLPALDTLYNEIKQNNDQTYSNIKNYQSSNENQVLEINNLYFNFNEDTIIENLNLSINKSTIVGIYGGSGTGKSTLAELILGLIIPSKGNIIFYKNKTDSDYSKNIVGYVPQNIFILDESISNNISLDFTINYYKVEKINKILKIVGLDSFIKNLPNGIDTIIGERGAKISGGQLQRIGIARALYNDFDILIMDEATNSLDKNNRNKIFECLLNLKKQNKTIILISHEEAILKKCDVIYRLQDKKLKKIDANF